MNVKVEINGLDTSKLPKLSQKEQMEMLRNIKNGKVELKDEFIEANYDIGSWITKRYGESKIQILIIERGTNEYQYDSEITLLWL